MTLNSSKLTFVTQSQIRKEEREQYPKLTVRFSQWFISVFSKGIWQKLMSETIKDILNTLDNIIKECAMDSVGLNRPKTEFVSHKHGELLFFNGVIDTVLILDFLWYLIWVSKPGWIPLHAFLPVWSSYLPLVWHLLTIEVSMVAKPFQSMYLQLCPQALVEVQGSNPWHVKHSTVYHLVTLA